MYWGGRKVPERVGDLLVGRSTPLGVGSIYVCLLSSSLKRTISQQEKYFEETESNMEQLNKTRELQDVQFYSTLQPGFPSALCFSFL